MNDVFVVKNQDGYFISKQKEWITGREAKAIFRSPYKDEAINMVFELSSKDTNLRAEAINVKTDDNKLPLVEVTAPEPEIPEPEINHVEDTGIDNEKITRTELLQAETTD